MITQRWYRKTGSLLLALFLLFVFTKQSMSQPAYEMGPRDVLTVVVFAGGVQQVKVDLTISNQGTINFPFIGAMKASGLTSSGVEEKVQIQLAADFFINPEIHVQVKEYNSLQYSISGAVKKPGSYNMLSKTTIFDLITKAGGVKPGFGNVAYVIRKWPGDSEKKAKSPESTASDPIIIDLLKFFNEGDFSNNINLETGDSVYVPFAAGLNQSASKILLSGEVAKPGVYEYQVGLTALAACILAGDFTKFAAPNRAVLIRSENEKQKIINIDINEIIKGKKVDVPLKPGDRLTIPESWF